MRSSAHSRNAWKICRDPWSSPAPARDRATAGRSSSCDALRFPHASKRPRGRSAGPRRNVRTCGRRREARRRRPRGSSAPRPDPGSRRARRPSRARPPHPCLARRTARGSPTARTGTFPPAGSAVRLARNLNARATLSSGAAKELPATLRQLVVRARRDHVLFVTAEVEIAEKAACRERRLGDDTGRDAHRPRACRATEATGEERHRRPAVAEHDDARRLLGEVLANDELVGAVCRREPRGGRPVDRVRIVTGPVRTRAGDVGAGAAPNALHPAERKAANRRRGASGKVTSAYWSRATGRSSERAAPRLLGLRPRRGREALRSNGSDRPDQPTRRASARNVGGT